MNLHAIKVKYLGPTNSRGSRIKLSSFRFRDSVTIGYDSAAPRGLDQAQDWLTAHGFEIVGTAELDESHDVVLVSTFKDLKTPAI